MLRGVLLCLAFAATGPAMAEAPADIVFDVYRNDGDKPFGRHVIRFEETEDGALKVRTEVRLKVKLGFIPVFKYRHEAEETWRDGRLLSIRASTNDNGDEVDVALACADQCRQSAPESDDWEAPIWPASHWNRDALSNSRLFNATRGGIMPVEVTRLAADGFEHAGRRVMGEGYAVEGSVPYELYFDGDRLVGARFYLRGNRLSYVPATDADGTS